MIFHWLFCIQYKNTSIEWRETCFGSLRAKLILVPLGMAK